MPAQEPKPPVQAGTPKTGAKKQEKKKPSEAQKRKEEKHKKDSWLAIVGGDVHPVSGPVIPAGTVLVRNDKIVQVGRSVKLPEGTLVVDATRKHVCPGFVAVAARGALAVRGARGKEKARDRVDPFSHRMLMALATGITCAHEGPGGSRGLPFFFRGGSGGAFSGSPKGKVGGVIAKLTYGTLEGFEVRQPAGVYMKLSARSSSERVEMREALQKARDHLQRRKDWIKKLLELEKDAKRPDRPKTDEVTEALARCLEGELPLFINADRRADILACLKLCDEFKVPLVMDGGMEAWTVAADIGRRPVSLIICPRGRRSRSVRPYTTRHLDAPHGWSLRNAAILSRTGIPWAVRTLSTGMSTSGIAGRDLLWLPLEAAFAVRGGATNEDALRSITLTAAEVLKIDERVGSLEPGKDADILIMDREPLDYRSFVDKAYVNGRLAYDRSRVNLWSHIRTDRNRPPGPWKPYGIWSPFPGKAARGGNGSGR